MRHLLLVGFALAFVVSATSAEAKPCRDSHGHFVKCDSLKPTKCRDAKGHFIRCSR